MPIVNLSSYDTNRSQIISELGQLQQEIWLSGSRFFSSRIRIDSDFDFATEETNEILSLIQRHGFVMSPRFVAGSSYAGNGAALDDNVACVYKHPSGVDIQIVRDLERKKLTDQTLATLPFYARLPKQDRNLLYLTISTLIGRLPR